MPAHLWEHAMHYWVYVHNLTPRVVLDGKTPWEVFTKRPSLSLPKFYFGERVTCYVDERLRQTKAAKQVNPLGKMQLPSGEARYLGRATDPLTYSFPGGHRVWETAEGKVGQYAGLVVTNPFGMVSTREHRAVYSELNPPVMMRMILMHFHRKRRRETT